MESDGSNSRRNFLAGATASAASLGAATRKAKHAKAPSLAELDRVAALPVLKRDGLTSPVIIDSLRLLKKDRDYLIHIRSKDGAEGIALVRSDDSGERSLAQGSRLSTSSPLPLCIALDESLTATTLAAGIASG